MPVLAQSSVDRSIQAALGEGQTFNSATLVDLARGLSKRPYATPPRDLPEAFSSLTYDQYINIRTRDAARVWADQNLGYTIEPLHRGFQFTSPVSLYTVDDGTVHPIAYDPAAFDFGTLTRPKPDSTIGFSGLRLFSTKEGASPLMAVFQGATFFRALASGQNLGTMARALTLKPAETRGEEFAAFRAFWIERPGPGAEILTLHALFDSESATGAVRFTVRFGDVTIIDAETTLFPRVALEHVGLGGMTTTFLFGPQSHRIVDEVRPAVHEASGLQILTGHDEWIWRPLINPETLQISAFADISPKGFGLIQRERDPAAFQDDDQHFEQRPSLWIEPLGDWGEGAVQMIEIPTDSDINDNVLAYWRPRQPYPAGAEVMIAYRQFWCWLPPERPALAIVAATRTGRGSAGRNRRFLVDFTGDDVLTKPGAKEALIASSGAVRDVRLLSYPERKTVRVLFEFEPGDSASSDLRLVLEREGVPLSETWLYRWTP